MKNIAAPHFNVGFKNGIPIEKCRRHDLQNSAFFLYMWHSIETIKNAGGVNPHRHPNETKLFTKLYLFTSVRRVHPHQFFLFRNVVTH